MVYWCELCNKTSRCVWWCVVCVVCVVLCDVCCAPCAVCGVPIAVCRVSCAVCHVPCAVCGVSCAVCGVPCAVCHVPCGAVWGGAGRGPCVGGAWAVRGRERVRVCVRARVCVRVCVCVNDIVSAINCIEQIPECYLMLGHLIKWRSHMIALPNAIMAIQTSPMMLSTAPIGNMPSIIIDTNSLLMENMSILSGTPRDRTNYKVNGCTVLTHHRCRSKVTMVVVIGKQMNKEHRLNVFGSWYSWIACSVPLVLMSWLLMSPAWFNQKARFWLCRINLNTL